MYKVLCIVVFKAFKAVGVYGVACKDNDKVGGCSSSGVAGGVGCDVDRLVFVFVCGGWFKELENSHARFTTNETADFMIPF